MNAGVLLNRDDFSQNVAGSGGCPATVTLKGGAAVYESQGDTCTFLRFGFGDEIQPRLGVSYQLRAGKGDKAYAQLGPLLQHGPEIERPQSRAEPHLPDADGVRSERHGPVERSARVDDRQDDRSGDQADLHRRDPGRLRDAVRAERYSLDVFFMSRTMHNFIEDVPSRMAGTAPDSGPFVAVNLPCVAFAACQSADAQRTYRAVTVDVRRQLAERLDERRQLHLEPVRRQLRSRLLDHVRRLQHLVVHSGRPRAPTSRIRIDSVRSSKIGRTCSRCSARTR